MAILKHFAKENYIQKLDLIQKSLMNFSSDFFVLKCANTPRPKCIVSCCELGNTRTVLYMKT